MKDVVGLFWLTLYTPDPDYDFEQLCNEADHRLFNTILKSQSHVLKQLLPPALSQTYNFRKRLHTRQIPYRCSYLTDCKFLTVICQFSVFEYYYYFYY